MSFTFPSFCLLACTLTLGASAAAAQVAFTAASTTNIGAAPNGIAVVPSELLFTQPYCQGNQVRAIYQEDLISGTSSPVASIPETGICSENYIAISTGLGGFTAGDTFVTGASTDNASSSEVFKNGSTPFVDPIPNSQYHAGIVFDTTGTFNYNLIVTVQGAVQGYTEVSGSGSPTFTYLVPPGATPAVQYTLEGATVAPITYAPCPGCLFVTATLSSNVGNPNPTGNGEIFYVNPGTPSGSYLIPWSSTPGPEPEGLVFVGNNLSCSLAGPDRTPYNYFVSGYATDKENPYTTTGAILAYSTTKLSGYVGQFLVPDEQGVISAFSAPNTSTVFDTTLYQLEGSTILQCAGGTGCPATMGYWKHHAFPSSMFVNGTAEIGCKQYSAATLVSILNKNNAGGNAVTILGHQLIAAIANYYAGGRQTADASAAIASATSLLCANNINLTTSYVAASSTLGEQMVALANVLDTYNSSAPSCEGNGLSLLLPMSGLPTPAPSSPSSKAVSL